MSPLASPKNGTSAPQSLHTPSQTRAMSCDVYETTFDFSGRTVCCENIEKIKGPRESQLLFTSCSPKFELYLLFFLVFL